MSAPFRMAIGPAVGKIRGYMQEARPILEAQERTPEGIDRLRELLVKLRRSIANIEGKSNDWQAQLNGLEGQARQDEDQRFADFAQGGIHFLAWLDDAKETSDEIEILLADGSEASSRTQSEHSVELGRAFERNARIMRDQQRAVANPGRQEQPPRQNPPPVHLPQVRLPQFWGDALQWPEFWQAFERTVGNAQIDEGLKAHYLLECVKGRAQRALRGYRAIAEHYKPMVDGLTRQFGNEKAIKDALQTELINLPQANESAGSLRAYLEDVERICRSLTAMGQIVDESIIMMAIKNKLPRAIVVELLKMEKEKNEVWSVEKLREGLEEVVSVREEVLRCTLPGSSRPAQRERDNGRRQNKGYRPNGGGNGSDAARVFAMRAENSGNGRKPPLPCLFCKGSHWAGDCQKVRDVSARLKILSEQKRCTKCMKLGHAKVSCNWDGCCRFCQGDHHRALCFKKRNDKRSPQTNANATPLGNRQKGGQKVPSATTMAIRAGGGNPEGVVFMAPEIELIGGRGKRKAVTVFDSCSSANFISEEKARELKLMKMGEGELDIYPFLHTEAVRRKVTQVLVQILLETGEIEELIAYKVEKAAIPKVKVAYETNGMIVANEIAPDFLISMSHFWRFYRGVTPISDYLFRVDTTVGPVICGDMKISGNQKGMKAVSAIMGMEEKENAEMDVHQFWDLETIGVRDCPMVEDDKEAMKMFENSVRITEEGRYSVRFPFKCERSELPTNFKLTYRRFLLLVEKLKKNKTLLKEYDEVIRGQLQKGIVEEAKIMDNGSEHFIPHHPVFSAKKMRVVYDGSAHTREGKSINQCLYRGPILLPALVGLLLRFRTAPIVMWSDIEKAFHQLELEEEDREIVKFLWLKDPDKPVSASNLQVLRFRRVPFGVISSPFLLAAAVQHHLRRKGGKMAEDTEKNIYVDNILTRSVTVEEAWENYKWLKATFEEVGMNLREFISTVPS